MRTILTITLNLSVLALISSHDAVVYAQAAASEGWVTAGANAQRTSCVPNAAPGALKPIWVKPVEPYISQKVQIVAASGKLFLSTAHARESRRRSFLPPESHCHPRSFSDKFRRQGASARYNRLIPVLHGERKGKEMNAKSAPFVTT